MSSAPQQRPEPEELNQLSPDEWWELFDEVRRRMLPAYAAEGGAVEFIRKERDSDTADA